MTESALPSLSDAQLDAIERRSNSATPGPWFVRELDDVDAMSLVAVSTAPDTGAGERWPDFNPADIVAATLIQKPRYVDVGDGLWDENAQFIANSRSDVAALVAEVRRLRKLVRELNEGLQ